MSADRRPGGGAGEQEELQGPFRLLYNWIMKDPNSFDKRLEVLEDQIVILANDSAEGFFGDNEILSPGQAHKEMRDSTDQKRESDSDYRQAEDAFLLRLPVLMQAERGHKKNGIYIHSTHPEAFIKIHLALRLRMIAYRAREARK